MPTSNLMMPLLESNRIDEEDAKPYAPIGKRNIHFRTVLTDSAEPYSERHRSKPLKSAIKVNCRAKAEIQTEDPVMEASTAAIIKKIQAKYNRRNPLLIAKIKLKSEREQLNTEAMRYQKASCNCCAVSTAASLGLAVTSLITATCSPWSATIAAPFCLSACLWKKGNEKERRIRENISEENEIDKQLDAPDSQIMQP